MIHGSRSVPCQKGRRGKRDTEDHSTQEEIGASPPTKNIKKLLCNDGHDHHNHAYPHIGHPHREAKSPVEPARQEIKIPERSSSDAPRHTEYKAQPEEQWVAI